VNQQHTGRAGRRRILPRAAAALAGSLALALGVSAAPAGADTGSATATGTVAKRAAQQTVWSFGLNGRDVNGDIWNYPPKSGGGFGTRVKVGSGLKGASALFQNNSANTTHVNVYAVVSGKLRLFSGATSSGTVIATGWNVYNSFVTPGNLGGTANPDLLARDTSGVLWLYLSNSNGTFGGRNKVGAGWDAYTQIAGRDDLTGDGKADIVARDKAGVLWLYKGTGTYRSPFTTRVKIGTGNNVFSKFIGLGDNDGDGLNDLIARDYNGYLWFYAGTGSASAPFSPKVKIGHGWNMYNYLF
jgi:FG-GAP-like repeat